MDNAIWPGLELPSEEMIINLLLECATLVCIFILVYLSVCFFTLLINISNSKEPDESGSV